MNEDELIRELLRPLSADSRFSFGLTDDRGSSATGWRGQVACLHRLADRRSAFSA